MGYLVNLFNSSIIMIIIQKIFSIYLEKNIKILLFYGIATLISIIGHIRAEIIHFDKYEIKVRQWQNEENNIKVKIAHLSDLHLCPIYGRKLVEKIVNKLNNEKGISFVVLTGDIVDGDIFDNKINLSILEPFKKLKYKIYYVSGNHEEFTDKVRLFYLLERVGIIHLDNKFEILNHYKINLIGIDYIKNLDTVRGKLKNLISKVNNNLPNIFIHHVPIFKPDTLPDYNIFLFLCGHIHGGKCFPFTLIKFFLGRWITAIIEGLYTYKDKYFVYCCSGVGTSGPNSRCFVGANIGFITIEGD